MVHPYVMVHFLILITKRQAFVLREEFPSTLRMVLLFRNLVEAVQLFIPRSILVVNLAVNRKAGDFLQIPQGFFLKIEGIRHPAPLLTSAPRNVCLPLVILLRDSDSTINASVIQSLPMII